MSAVFYELHVCVISAAMSTAINAIKYAIRKESARLIRGVRTLARTGWEEFYDEDEGKYIYFNINTKETTDEKPRNLCLAQSGRPT